MLSIIITVFSVVLDQLTKWLVESNIELHDTVDFIPYVMSLYHTRNEGAAFSMLADSKWVFMTLSSVSILLIIRILYTERKRHVLLEASLAMILGGGIGNMIDRVRYGYVVDFFKTEFVDFAIFNVADCFVTLGAIGLGVYLVFFEQKVEKALREKQKAENGESHE